MNKVHDALRLFFKDEYEEIGKRAATSAKKKKNTEERDSLKASCTLFKVDPGSLKVFLYAYMSE